MKLLILFFSIFLNIPVFSQQVKADFHANYWAGGVCCSQGMDIGLTIRIKGSSKNCFDELQLTDSNGIIYTLKDSEFKYTNYGDTLQFYAIGFGYSSHSYGNEYDALTSQVNYHGPESLKDFRWNLGNANDEQALKIVLLRDRKRIDCDQLNISEDYTAYP